MTNRPRRRCTVFCLTALISTILVLAISAPIYATGSYDSAPIAFAQTDTDLTNTAAFHTDHDLLLRALTTVDDTAVIDITDDHTHTVAHTTYVNAVLDTTYVYLPLAVNTAPSHPQPATPASPSPCDCAVAPTDVGQLTWEVSTTDPAPAGYRVTLAADDPTPDTVIYEGPETSCELGPLEPGTRYYWQVAAEGGDGRTTTGPVWEFTTEAVPTEPTPEPLPAFAAEVVELTNAERAKVGCPALVVSPQLTEAALAHSSDMALSDFFSHTSLDGRSPWDRIKATGYTYSRAAENIAAGYSSPAGVVAAWMNSDGHRANMLNCALTEIGVGYYYHAGDDGRVWYRHYWTQDFATPR